MQKELKKKLKVSICSITYNHEKFIAQAIDSFLMQKTNFDLEIIVADDASTDNNQEIIKKYQKQYQGIINPVLRKVNVGMNNNFLMQYQAAKVNTELSTKATIIGLIH